MKKIFVLIVATSISQMIISMQNDPHLAVLYRGIYQREEFKNSHFGYLQSQTALEDARRILTEGEKKYAEIAKTWRSGFNSAKLKPFEICTMNDIDAYYNGDSSRLIDQWVD
jgi:hypothetical protein